MTEAELFPRGKTAKDDPSSKQRHQQQQSKSREQEKNGARGEAIKGGEEKKAKLGRKRKAPGAPAASPGASGRESAEEDWLFGSPNQAKVPSSTSSSKKSRGGQSLGGSRTLGDKMSSLTTSEIGSGMLVRQAGRAPRLEMVSFKKLSKGTLALGIVFKVNENDMVVSLPSSLTGVVRKKDVSDYFYVKAGAGGKKNRGGKGRYYDDEAIGDISLMDLFKEGQMVRCVILNLANESNGRHIELSLRPSVVNKGMSLSQLTPGCGVYGSVVSCEDHGYVMSLGLEGVTAFLPSKDAPSTALKPGQPVEAVVKMVKTAARTITLSAETELVASAVTKGTGFDLRSLKPGMLVDTIVDSVLSNGILVTFLGYFAGCVDHNNMPVVSGDDKEEAQGWRRLFKPGPEPVQARVLVVDHVNKAIRLTLRPHLLKMRAPSGLPPTGALLSGEVVRVDPALGLLLKVPSVEGAVEVAPSTNVVPTKKSKEVKEKGQGRRERRAKAAAEEAVKQSEQGNEGDDANRTGTVGAYVHISRISDERVDHVEKLFKPGQQVKCRVTGSSLVEGWSAASLKPSVLAAAVLRYQDLTPGAIVEGEVAAVESFGLLVKLGEGVRALVQKNHLGDTTVKNPGSRFKVGSRVKGKVLAVDARASKATLTLKRSMIKDKRPPMTSYEQAEKGVACTGFVTKVASFGLHVSFYNNVYGVLQNKALSRHGIEDPSQAFTVGQVVGCVVRNCDVTVYPPNLSLGLDVAGKTEEMGKAQDSDEDLAAEAVDCPFSPGDIVSGVVLETSQSILAQSGKISVDIADETNSKTEATIRGVIPLAHLGDHASIINQTLAARLKAGTSLERLLVVEVDKRGVPLLSLKPLLLLSARPAEQCAMDNGVEGDEKTPTKGQAFIPRGVSDLSPGDLVAGFVSKVETFGVFVRFLGGFTALAPRAMVADRPVEDPTGMFVEGDSVRCVVKKIDVETGRVAVTLSRASIPASPALYLRSLLSEMFAAKAASDPGTDSAAGSAGEVTTSTRRRFEFGVTCNATVVAVKEYGVVLKASPRGGSEGSKNGDGEGQLMLCSAEYAPEGVKEGLEVKVRVLGLDVEKGVVDVTMDPDLVKAGRSKKRRAMASLDPGEEVSVKIVLAKPDAKYAVASSADGRVFVVQVADFHCPHRTNHDAGYAKVGDGDDAESGGKESATTLVCRVGDSFSPSREGYWEGDEGGVGGMWCNPYAGAVLLVPEADDAIGKRKASRGRKREGEDLDLGDEDMERETAMQNRMKLGKIALGKVVPGVKVVCEVTSIHEDRLDVKLAVRYPKSYGKRGEFQGRRKSSSTGDDDDEGDGSAGDEKNEADGPMKSKKRRRDEDKGSGKDGAGDPDHDRKKIVRIRAKVHCTAAGLPGLDAPSNVASKKSVLERGRGVGSAATLPEWHPLSKYYVGQVLSARVLRTEDQPGKKDSNLVFRLIELGVTEDEEADKEGGDDISSALTRLPWWGESNPKRGEVYRGMISEVGKSGPMVSLSTSVRGLLPWASVLGEKEAESRLNFEKGMGIRVLVRNVEPQQQRLILTLKDVPSQEELPDSKLPGVSQAFLQKVPQHEGKQQQQSASKTEMHASDDTSQSTSTAPEPGHVVLGRASLSVKQWNPPCLMVKLDGGVMGRVCLCELGEESEWRTEPLAKFREGKKVRCRVLPSSSKKGAPGNSPGTNPSLKPVVELSLRASRLDSAVNVEKAIEGKEAPAVGSVVKCYVVSTGKSGCFVRMDGGVSGRVLLKLLSDRYVSNPAQEFPAGKLVVGKVLEKDESTGQVSLTLQESQVRAGEKGFLTWESGDLKKGLKVKGRVSSVREFGVFIHVKGSTLTGMCHRSEAADRPVSDLTTVYDEGDLVKAKVLQVDKKRKRLTLGLKASYFEGDADSSSEDEDEDADEEGLREVEMTNPSPEGDEVEIQSEKTPDEPLVVTPMEEGSSSPDEEDENAGEDSDDSESESDGEPQKPAKKLRGILSGITGTSGVGGSGSNAFSLNFGDYSVGSGGVGGRNDHDDSSSDSEDEDTEGKRGHRSRQKAKERRQEEERIVARERALQDDDTAPETAGDYERLIIASPNESLLWVKFMAFKLGLADTDGARAVAERGLKAISFREEQERYNVWVALLNLEHKFGTRDSLKEVSDRACQNSKPKRIYLHLAETHDKAKEVEQCEEVFQAAAKKFRHSKKVWMAYQLSRLSRGDDKGAREILQRSLQSLAKHKHVSVISRFAQNEFEYGSIERGRSIFEGLMASYPKRLDLWNVYLDKEVKAGELRAARNLLERLTGMEFNAKRMKGVFKKYMQFETDHGDEAGVENVKAKAMEYVASLTGND